jgi:hypothetical protein
MTANRDGRQERGLALADALLAEGRELPPLSSAAHARVKRRLTVSTRRRPIRAGGWLRPVVVASIFLACGAAFGVAVDRVVLRRGESAAPGDDSSKGGRARGAGRKGRVKTGGPAVTETTSDSPPAAIESAPSNVPTPTPAIVADPTAPKVQPSPGVAVHPRKLAWRQEPAPVAPVPPSVELQPVAPTVPSSFPAERPAPPIVQAPAPSSVPPSGALPTSKPASSPGASAGEGPTRQAFTEERLLAAAARALRAQTDPRSALAALDEYRAHYPQGRLFVEAEILRADSLVALKDSPGALRVLDGLDFAHVPGGLVRQLQRGELRAELGKPALAEADFTAVLVRARSEDRDVVERALWRRSQSRARRGDQQGAHEDAGEYLRRFPSGRFAAAALQMNGGARR